MKFVPNSVSRAVARQVLLGRKHSPTILFGAGVVGVVTTTVLASRATLKLTDVLDEHQKNMEMAKSLQHSNYSEEDRSKDVAYIYVKSVVAVGKLYAPAIAVGTLSIAALTGSHHILSKRNAALTAAYAALEKGFNEYRARVIDDLGEDKDREYRFGKATYEIEEKDSEGKTKKVKKTGPNEPSIYARFFDELTPSWQREPEYNMMFLRNKQNWLNDMLHARGHVFLNEAYDELGLDRSKAGAVVGWILSENGDNFIDFGIFDGDRLAVRDFVNGRESAILLDFNVDGVIYDKI